MIEDNFNPNIDSKTIQEKVNEYALRGAVEAIEKYYTGFDSPYKQKIKESLDNKDVNGIELPDIIANINDSLSKEIDTIANSAIAKTYIPLVKNFLTRAPSKMKFSEILEDIVKEEIDKDIEDYTIDDYQIDMKKDEQFKWYNVSITTPNNVYNFTLHEVYYLKSEKEKLKEKGNFVQEYQILSLPRDYDISFNNKMTLKIKDDVSLDMPFTKDILKDSVMRIIARLVIANTHIIIDTKEFDEDMFPEDECHC